MREVLAAVESKRACTLVNGFQQRFRETDTNSRLPRASWLHNHAENNNEYYLTVNIILHIALTEYYSILF